PPHTDIYTLSLHDALPIYERIWTSGDPDSDRRIVEIGSGMNYWDGEKWTPSDPSFEVTADAFVADRMQYKVRLDANLNQIGAVTDRKSTRLNSSHVAISYA